MRKYRLIVTDLDGVVWRGGKPLKQNIMALNQLIARGVKVKYLTNNATKSRPEYVEILRKLGLQASIDDVITSAYAATRWISEQGGRFVFIIGEAGLYYEAVVNELIPVSQDMIADYVIVGLDRHVTYSKVRVASRMISGGAVFVVANTDSTLPVEDGVDPGAGSIVEMIVRATGRKPDFNAGKPNTWILDLAIRSTNKEEVLVIGDRVDTDIALGNRAGVDTLLVLTGTSKPEDLESSPYMPTYVAKDLYSFINDYPELFG